MAVLSVRMAGAAGNPTVAITLDKSSLSSGSTALVTFTFSAPPVGFSNEDVDLSDAHGTLSPVTQDAVDPKIYTATFTPDSGVVAPNSTISVGVNWTDGVNPPDVASVSASTFFPNAALGPAGIDFDGTNTWMANRDDDSVTRISPTGTMTTYKVTQPYPVAIAFDGTNMWTANHNADSVTKITPNGVATHIALPAGSGPTGIIFGGDAIWTANQGSGSVTRISTTGVITTYPAVGAGPTAIAFDGTNAWVTNRGSNSVSKIAPTGVVTSYAGTGNIPVAIAFDGSNMWTANVGGGSVTKITPTGVMTTYNGVGSGPTAIAFDGSNMWTANSGDNSLGKITLGGTVSTLAGAGASPAGIVFAGNRLWVTNNDVTKNGVTRFGIEHAAVSASFSVSTASHSTCPSPSVQLVLPNGGETLVAGSDVDVFWSSAGCQVVSLNLLLSTDSGATWPVTVGTSPMPTSGYFKWTVPDMDSATARLRADLVGQGGALLASDVSDGVFTVRPTATATSSGGTAPPAPPAAPQTTPPPTTTSPPAAGSVSPPASTTTPPAPPAKTFPGPAAPPTPNVPVPLGKTSTAVVDDKSPQPRTAPPANALAVAPAPPVETQADNVSDNAAAPPAPPSTTPPPMVSLDQVQQAVDTVATAAPASWSWAITFAEGALAMLGLLAGAQQVLKRRGASGTQKCTHCFGSGKEPKKNVALGTCEDCEGSGMAEEENEQTVECKHCEGEGEDPCHFCKGKGTDDKGQTCEHCEGEGVTPSGKKDKNGKSKPKRCCKCFGKGELDVNIKSKSPCTTCAGTGKV